MTRLLKALETVEELPEEPETASLAEMNAEACLKKTLHMIVTCLVTRLSHCDHVIVMWTSVAHWCIDLMCFGIAQ